MQTLAEVTMAEVTREARVRASLSMRGLARRSGLSAAQVSRIEAGEGELATVRQAADEARERVAAEPLRQAHERLREVGVLAQRRAVEVAEKRRQFEQLDDAPSEEVCALAGRLFLHTAAGGDHVEAW